MDFVAGHRVPDACNLQHKPDSCPESAPLWGHDDLDRRRLVRRALARLDANDRRLLLMTLADGLKVGEIARRLGITPQAARARKSRALRKVIDHVRGMMTDGHPDALAQEDSIA